MDNVQSTNLNEDDYTDDEHPPLEPPPQYTRSLAHAFISDQVGLSKTTIKSYESKLRSYLDTIFCPNDIREVDEGLLEMFFREFSKHHTPSTTASVHRVLKLFFAWYADGVDRDSPMRKIKAPRVPKKIIDPVSLDTINQMLQYCNIRCESILLFLLDSGCRSREFLDLNVDDVDILTGRVYIRNGKGNKPRTVFISPRARKVLKKYLKERKVQDKALWTTSVGKRLSYSALNVLLKRIAAKAKVPPPNPQDFRRACGTNLMLSGASLEMIRVYLGHAGYSILTQYLKQTDDDLMLSHRQHSPVDRL